MTHADPLASKTRRTGKRDGTLRTQKERGMMIAEWADAADGVTPHLEYRAYRPPVQEPSPGLAAILFGLCWGFVLGIVFSLIVKAVLS